MKNSIVTLILCVLVSTIGFSQSTGSLVDSYISNFDRGNYDVKLELIQEAAALNSADMAPLFHRAINFANTKSSLFARESTIRQFVTISVRQIQKFSYKEARHSLWKLFQLETDYGIKGIVLEALAITAQGDASIAMSINEWLRSQNDSFKAGKQPLVQIINTCINTLAQLGDESSFHVIFTTMLIHYSDETSRLARQALFIMGGDFKKSIMQVITNGNMIEKKEVLDLAIDANKLNDTQKGEVAEYALNVVLHVAPSNINEQRIVREIRQDAVRALSNRNWSKATEDIITHFDFTLAEYDRDLVSKAYIIEAIVALGNMGTHKAAVRLTLYLDYINDFTESGQNFDEQIVLAVVESLGKLGDKIAFDELMYTKYLNYPKIVKDAAEEASKKLKW